MRRTLIIATTLAMAAFIAAPGTTRPAHAEVLELVDKTRMSGEIIHYFDGIFTVKTGESTVKIPKEKVRHVTYDLPPPRAEFSTPQKTFERWRKALANGELETLIDCYALMYQGFLASQMGGSGDEAKKMKDELKGAAFTVKGASQKKDSATLKVEMKKEDSANTADIAFVRENGEWKMLPMAMP
jgi:hypothetical protein